MMCTKCVERWVSGGQENNLKCPICRELFATSAGGGFAGGYGSGQGWKPMAHYVVVTRPRMGLGVILPDE
jgi:hypothetical protein